MSALTKILRALRPTPGGLVILTLLVEAVLFLSEPRRWFRINYCPGLTALIAADVVAVALTVLIGWLAISALRRRPARFGLRTAGLLVLAVAIPCGWIAVERNAARDEAAAIRRIVNAGGHGGAGWASEPDWMTRILGDKYFARTREVFLASDDDLAELKRLPYVAVVRLGFVPTAEGWKKLQTQNALRTLMFAGVPLRDADFAPAAELMQVESLHLKDTPITDAGLDHFATWRALRNLELSGTQITDAGLSRLARNSALNSLGLSGTQIGDAGLKRLSALRRLTDLHLKGTPITDDGLAAVGELPELDFLDVSGTTVTGAGLRDWPVLPRLRSISAEDTPWTDEGLEYLGRQTELRDLDLERTKITKAGLMRLAPLKKLRAISLRGTAVNTDDTAELQAALPGCRILADPPPAAAP